MPTTEPKYIKQRSDDSNQDADSGDSRNSGEHDTGSGKVANAHNSGGDQPPTQLNQERRTPESRHDREVNVGSGNQVQSRKGAPGSGSSTQGRGGHRGAG